MASLCGTAARPSRVVRGFHRPSGSGIGVLKLTPISFNLRYKNTVRLQIRQRLFPVFQSNSNTSWGDSDKENSDGSKTSDAAQGPPFLTILAGLLVSLLVCWIVGSLIVWLIGLVVKFPPSN